jgi:hypothetical protein
MAVNHVAIGIANNSPWTLVMTCVGRTVAVAVTVTVTAHGLVILQSCGVGSYRTVKSREKALHHSCQTLYLTLHQEHINQHAAHALLVFVALVEYPLSNPCCPFLAFVDAD